MPSTPSIWTIEKAVMRKYLMLLCTLACVMCLSACGGNSGELDALRQENERLCQQVTALEDEKAALTAENDVLKEKTDAQDVEKVPDQGTSQEEANPIDEFYDGVEIDGSTVSMNLVEQSRADAWEAETRALAERLKARLPLQEDKDLVDDYMAAAEAQTDRMDIMAIYPVSDVTIYPVSDVTIPQAERIYASGTLRGVLWAGSDARIWRDTFWQLLDVSPEWEYDASFIFDPEIARQELEEFLNVG